MTHSNEEVVPTTEEQEAFSKQYHWFYGLDEYFEFTGQIERWQVLKKAVLQQNWYRIRDVVIELATMPNSNPAHTRAWINALLREKVSAEVKPQMMATLVRKFMHEDTFMVNTCKFVNYWAGEDGEAAQMPDMNDFLSRGQVKSKLWMVTELAKVVEGPLGNIAFYGGWYNFMAHFLFSQFDVDKIYSLDVDGNVVAPSKRLYPTQVEEGRFLPKTINVSKIKWNEKVATVPTNQTEGEDPGEYWELDTINMVVNTSCEHMDDDWYDNLPTGTFVVLQTNDYFSNPQHSNCVKDLEEAKTKYPMQSLAYAGTLDTQLYNRFMLIGIK